MRVVQFFREVRCKTGRVVREADPYGGVTRGAVRCRWATARVAPTEGYKRCGAVRYPPVTASPCQPPLGKGAEGTDCHTSDIGHWFAMT